MTTGATFSYAYQDADISLGHVASRFRTTVKALWINTASRDGKFKNVREEEFITTVRSGDIIYVDYEGDAWKWRSVQPKTGTLKEFCLKKTDPARVGGPQLTPEFLWFHIINEARRARHLARLGDLDSKRNLDQDPGALTLKPEDEFMVPYPVRDAASIVKAAPGAKGASAVMVAAPEWISVLLAFEQKINTLVDQIEASSNWCNQLQGEGQVACYHIAALARLVAFQVNRAEDKLKGPLRNLQSAIGKLQTSTVEFFFANPAQKLHVQGDSARKQFADDLVKVLHDANLKTVLERVRKAPNERAKGQTVVIIADRMMERGYRALASTQIAETAKKDIDAAFDRLVPEGATAPVDSSTPLATYVAFAGSASAAATSTVGNLPGPSSLSGAIVELWVKFKLPVVLEPAAKVAEVRAAGFQAIAENKPEDLVEVCKTLRLTAKPAATRGRAAFILAAALNQQEIDELDRILKNGYPAKAKELATSVAARTQASTGWHGVLGALNAIALISTIEGDDSIAARKWVNIFSGSVNTAIGGLQTLASYAPNGVLGKALGAAGPFFGTVAATGAIVTGAMSALCEQEPKSIVSGAAQMVGGALSVGGYMLSCPVTQALGMAILLGSAIFAGADAVKQITMPGTKQVMLIQLGAFQERDIYKRMVKAYPFLATDLTKVLDLINANDNAGLFEMDPTPETLSFLRATGFLEGDVRQIASRAAGYHRYEF